MFEFICILNLFINVFLISKLKNKEEVVVDNVITSDIDKEVNNTPGLFNRLYGRF
jgi:hypothetical protein